MTLKEPVYSLHIFFKKANFTFSTFILDILRAAVSTLACPFLCKPHRPLPAKSPLFCVLIFRRLPWKHILILLWHVHCQRLSFLVFLFSNQLTHSPSEVGKHLTGASHFHSRLWVTFTATFMFQAHPPRPSESRAATGVEDGLSDCQALMDSKRRRRHLKQNLAISVQEELKCPERIWHEEDRNLCSGAGGDGSG